MKIGDKIKIVSMEGESQYEGKEEVVQFISKDPWVTLLITELGADMQFTCLQATW